MVKRLFSYAGDYKKYVFLAPLFVVLETAGELALPLLIARIIDDGIMVGNLPMIYRIGVYMLIMAIAAVFLGAFGAKFGSYGSIGMGANLRQAEFAQHQPVLLRGHRLFLLRLPGDPSDQRRDQRAELRDDDDPHAVAHAVSDRRAPWWCCLPCSGSWPSFWWRPSR